MTKKRNQTKEYKKKRQGPDHFNISIPRVLKHNLDLKMSSHLIYRSVYSNVDVDFYSC